MASGVFLFMYMHVVRAWTYSVLCTVHLGVWALGILVWLLMMGVAFMGYVLP